MMSSKLNSIKQKITDTDFTGPLQVIWERNLGILKPFSTIQELQYQFISQNKY